MANECEYEKYHELKYQAGNSKGSCVLKHAHTVPVHSCAQAASTGLAASRMWYNYKSRR